MDRMMKFLFLALFLVTISACGSTSGSGDSGCSNNADCASYCDFTGTWRAGAAGSTTNGGYCAGGDCYCCYALFSIDPETTENSDGRCLACNEVGTNCNADALTSCYSSEDVCLFGY